jgi:hypothetical protein
MVPGGYILVINMVSNIPDPTVAPCKNDLLLMDLRPLRPVRSISPYKDYALGLDLGIPRDRSSAVTRPETLRSHRSHPDGPDTFLPERGTP